MKEEAGLTREGDSVTSKNYDVIGNRIRNQETAEPFLLGIIFFQYRETNQHPFPDTSGGFSEILCTYTFAIPNVAGFLFVFLRIQ